MIRGAILSALSLLALPASAQIAVSGDWVRLGDVAPVSGEAAQVLVAPAPPPGEQLALDPVFLASVARQSGVIVALPADSPIFVTRAGAPVPAAPPAPQAAPQAATAPTPRGGAVLPLDGAPQPDWILVAAGPVARGAVLHRSDLKWASPDSVRGSVRNAVFDLSDAVGMELKRTLRADAPLQITDLKPAAVIHKGDTVQLVYQSGGVRLATSGLAQQDAARGEPVRILNQYTKRTIEAIAYAEGEARVGG